LISPSGLLQATGSLKLTLVLFILLSLCVIGYYFLIDSRWLIVVPLLLLSINLLAAIVVYPTLRYHYPLLVFHLSLLALLLMIVAGQLSQFKGSVEITEGVPFAGEPTHFQAGPFHQQQLNKLQFLLHRFNISYAPGPVRDVTQAEIEWLDNRGESRRGIVGDHLPLIIDGYRFYTTHNKGFAPIFSWQPDSGAQPQTGAVHLPAYPAHEHNQAQSWNLPGSDTSVWINLQFDEVILDPEHHSQFHPPGEHTLVLRIDKARHELEPGDTIKLPGGELTYNELRSWMGFSVSYDWSLPWLLAACLVAVASIGWHYWRKCAASPWLNERDLTVGE